MDAVGGRGDGNVFCAERTTAVLVLDVVERTLYLFAQAELDDGLTQTVRAALEAYGFVLVGETAVDATGDVDQRRVREVADLGTFEVVGLALVEWHGGQAVAVTICLDEVLADGYGNLVFTIAIGHHRTVLATDQLTVNLELYAIHGDIRIQVSHRTLQGERRRIVEVEVVERQTAIADESVARRGREFVDAAGRHDGIGRAAAHEGNAADDVFAVVVGQRIARQLAVARNDGRSTDVVTHRSVAAVGHVVGVGGIEHVVVQAFVHRPVECQTRLATV